MARPNANTNASLNGTVKGATTLVAISVAPGGSLWIRGSATNVNSLFMYMPQGMKQMPTASMALSSRSRSSSKCDIRVPSASSPGSPGSLMGGFGVGYVRIGCVHGCRSGGRGRQSTESGLRLARRRRDLINDLRRICGWNSGHGRSSHGRSSNGSACRWGSADGGRGGAGLGLALRLQQFVRVDLAFQLFAQLACHGARPSHPVAYLACNLGQPLRTQHDECYGGGKQYLREPTIKHAGAGVGFRRGLYLGLARRRAGVEVRVLFLLELLHFLFRFAVVHGLFEAFDGRAQVRPDRAQTLSAEYHQGDGQYDQ